MANPPRPTVSRRQVLRVLALDGTGELCPAQVGALSLERGSICIRAVVTEGRKVS